LARLGYADGIYDVLLGYRVAGAAPLGYVLRGDGGKFVSHRLDVSDLSVSAVGANYLPKSNGSTLVVSRFFDDGSVIDIGNVASGVGIEIQDSGSLIRLGDLAGGNTVLQV